MATRPSLGTDRNHTSLVFFLTHWTYERPPPSSSSAFLFRNKKSEQLPKRVLAFLGCSIFNTKSRRFVHSRFKIGSEQYENVDDSWQIRDSPIRAIEEIARFFNMRKSLIGNSPRFIISGHGLRHIIQQTWGEKEKVSADYQNFRNAVMDRSVTAREILPELSNEFPTLTFLKTMPCHGCKSNSQNCCSAGNFTLINKMVKVLEAGGLGSYEGDITATSTGYDEDGIYSPSSQKTGASIRSGESAQQQPLPTASMKGQVADMARNFGGTVRLKSPTENETKKQNEDDTGSGSVSRQQTVSSNDDWMKGLNLNGATPVTRSRPGSVTSMEESSDTTKRQDKNETVFVHRQQPAPRYDGWIRGSNSNGATPVTRSRPGSVTSMEEGTTERPNSIWDRPKRTTSMEDFPPSGGISVNKIVRKVAQFPKKIGNVINTATGNQPVKPAPKRPSRDDMDDDELIWNLGAIRKRTPSVVSLPIEPGRNLRKRPSPIEEEPPEKIALYAGTYLDIEMYPKGKGIVKIFSQDRDREGNQEDIKSLITLFKFTRQIDCNVEEHKNYSRQDIVEELADARSSSKYKRNDYKFIIVIIMAHGDNGTVDIKETDGKVTTAYTGEYILDSREEPVPMKIFEEFLTEGLDYFRGKPKILLVQACRGGKRNKMVHVDSVPCPPVRNGLPSISQGPQKVLVPKLGDYLIVYATLFDTVSYRDRNGGTFFIQEFCRQLQKAPHENFELVMLKVANLLAKREVVDDEEAGGATTTQVLMKISTLTKQFLCST